MSPPSYDQRICLCFLVLQLHREFLRAGSDVMQTFTFYASEDKLDNRGNEAASKHGVCLYILNFLQSIIMLKIMSENLVENRVFT